MKNLNTRYINRIIIGKNFNSILLMSFLFLIAGEVVFSQNPIVTHMYTADPSAHVWSDGRLYVYPSHDIYPPQGCDLMDQYHVFSTDDMINWTDHGEILRASQVPWGRPEGGFMWAPDCAFKNDTFYFYFPHPSETEWNTSWKIGIATSIHPAGDFTVKGYIQGLDPMIDPCVFIDDDNQAYFYYGGGGVCKGGKLKDNMMEIDGAMQNMTGLVDFHEATWVHKRNGVYYLSYSDNNDVGDLHNQMRYATSDNPLGPWTYRGIYMDPTDSYTNHGSIVEYKGQWYSFYHNSALSNHDWLRSICVDSLFYNEDGTIKKVVQTKRHGTPYKGAPLVIPGLIEVEDFDLGGRAVAYGDNDTTNNGNQYRIDEGVDIETCSAGGYSVGWTNSGEWLEYTVNIAETDTYDIEIKVASPSGSAIRIEFGGINKTGSVNIPATGGWQTWQSVYVYDVPLNAGTQIMKLSLEGGNFNIDKFIFSPDGFDLNYKLMMGYQGWFLCRGDGSSPNEWRHWFQSTITPSAANLNVDMWPDMTEYTKTYPTQMTYLDGSQAKLFSSHDSGTTNLHFKWMKDYGIYGVYLQRFLGEVMDQRFFKARNNVLKNVIGASEKYDRHFAIMYDISGVADDGNMYDKLVNDWKYLVDSIHVTEQQGYVKQNDLPVLAIWGIGFSERGLTTETFEAILDFFHNDSDPKYRAYIVGGVPGQWRTLNSDSETDSSWLGIYHSLDMISPWAVGRYSSNSGADNWKNQRIIPDLADCNTNGIDYMPVIWPGFSWYNMHDGTTALNQIPRNGGKFFWRQAYNAIDAGVKFVYVAMFDEVDEGTAMFKITPLKDAAPVEGSFVNLDRDGYKLPSDWYLRLAHEAQKMLDTTIALTDTIPIVSPVVPVTGVTVTPSDLTLGLDTVFQLQATVIPANATFKNVSWNSDNTDVARVSTTGLITVVGEGNAVITLKTYDGNKTATCEVNVTEPVSGFDKINLSGKIKVNPMPASDRITISSDLLTSSPVQISIYNLQGALVKSINIENEDAKKELTMGIGDLQAGVYLMKLNSSEFMAGFKLIVK